MPELGRSEAVGRAHDFVSAAITRHYETAHSLAAPEVFDDGRRRNSTMDVLVKQFEEIRPLDLGRAKRTMRGTPVENGLTM